MFKQSRSDILICAADHSFSLSDCDLASQTYRLSEQVLSQLDKSAGFLDEADIADISFVFASILPEVARRLTVSAGASPCRKADRSMGWMPDYMLREMLIRAFLSDSHQRLTAALHQSSDQSGFLAIDFAFASAVNGNVALLAMDRVAPPQKDDAMGRIIDLAGSLRGCGDVYGMWTPRMTRVDGSSLQSEHMICSVLDAYYTPRADVVIAELANVERMAG